MDKTENYYCPAKDITRHVEIWLKKCKKELHKKINRKNIHIG